MTNSSTAKPAATSTNTNASSTGHTAQRHQGAVCWNELHTRDLAGAKDFYTKVIGWTPSQGQAAGGAGYVEWVDAAGAHNGGMMAMPAGVPKEVPAHWAIYINVDDVDAAAAKAVMLGGRKVTEPMDVPNIGRLCVVADPTGATFHLFKGVGDCGTRGPQMGAGSFCWVELLTSDPVAAQRFYTALLGWKTSVMPMPTFEYTLLWRADADIAARTGGVGGMMKIQPEWGAMPSAWLTYIMVPDVDVAAERAKAHGGTLCSPPSDIPNVGRMAVVTDPTGATFALFTGKQ